MRIDTVVIVLVIAFLAVAGTAVAADKGVLDGKSFAGECVEKGKTSGAKDDLIFADGSFRSTACDKYGFGSAAYTAKKEGDSVAFESHTTSKKEGKMHWTGKVTGESCEATLIWSKPGGKDIVYSYKGTLKKTKK